MKVTAACFSFRPFCLNNDNTICLVFWLSKQTLISRMNEDKTTIEKVEGVYVKCFSFSELIS